MANTYTLIASTTVGSGGASSIDFTSIPSTYTDLKVVISARTAYAAVSNDLILQFNGDTGANYSTSRLEANGSGSASDNFSNGALYGSFMPMSAANATASTFGNGEAYIPNYTSSNKKSFATDSISENNATSAYMSMTAAIWSGTSAITSIKIRSYHGSTLQEFSTAYLYGIKNS